MSEELANELVHKHRPTLFKEVVGQEGACQTLGLMLRDNRLPHALNFTGPSGTGKTTLARILTNKLKVDHWNLKELNAAESRGIDTIRDIQSAVQKKSLVPGNRAWIIDEAHKLTSDAQNAFLKPLEEPPRDVYFFLATTDASKLIPTIRTRCTEIKVGLVPHEKLVELVKAVSVKEKSLVSDECAERIADVAEGCARKALVILQTVLPYTTEADRLDAIQRSELKKVSIDLCRALWGDGRRPPSFGAVADVLKTLDDDVEGVRRLVMGYFASIMVKSPSMARRCATVMNYFRDPFYDNAGKSMLTLACYEACEALR